MERDVTGSSDVNHSNRRDRTVAWLDGEIAKNNQILSDFGNSYQRGHYMRLDSIERLARFVIRLLPAG